MASPRIELGTPPRQRGILPLNHEAFLSYVQKHNLNLEKSYLNPPKLNLFKHNLPYKNMFGKKKHKPEVGEHKFCPVCGTKLQLSDAFCLRCGYSFSARVGKNKKRVNWRSTIIIIGILVLAYFGLRYANGQTIIPTSLVDALKTLTGK